MAMNKKEKEQFDSAVRLMAVNRSLRWSDYMPDRDVCVPDGLNEFVNGWSINTYSGCVYKSWSSTVSHGNGWVESGERPKSASQRGIPQYSSEEKALKALRHCMEMKFAEALYEIDQQISKVDSE